MKHFFLFLLLFPLTVVAQEDVTMVSAYGDTLAVDTMAEDCAVPFVQEQTFDCKNTFYWQRNRVKKFAAGSCIAVGGVSLGVYGIVRIVASAFGESDFGWFDALWGGGSAGLMAASIPLYVSAAKDRKKARNMTLEEYQADHHRKDYRRNGFRYQPSFMLNIPFDDQGDSRRLGWGFGLEGRSYIGESDFDLGVKFSFDKTCYYEAGSYYHEDYYEWENHYSKYSLRLTVLGDYNFRKNALVNPFVGAGLGFSPTAHVFVEPRAGLEFSRHHRLTLGTHLGFITDDDATLANNVYLEFGYTF